jgi:hypothetical protein
MTRGGRGSSYSRRPPTVAVRARVRDVDRELLGWLTFESKSLPTYTLSPPASPRGRGEICESDHIGCMWCESHIGCMWCERRCFEWRTTAAAAWSRSSRPRRDCRLARLSARPARRPSSNKNTVMRAWISVIAHSVVKRPIGAVSERTVTVNIGFYPPTQRITSNKTEAP